MNPSIGSLKTDPASFIDSRLVCLLCAALEVVVLDMLLTCIKRSTNGLETAIIENHVLRSDGKRDIVSHFDRHEISLSAEKPRLT